MKKTALALLMAVITGAAMAVEPVPGNTTMTSVNSPNEATALLNESTNKVIIDQVGDNINISVLQEGSGNTFGSLDRPVYLRGIGQTITTNQTGNNNSIYLEMKNSMSGEVGATVNIRQNGNNNQVDAQCGVGINGGAGFTGGNVFAATALTGCNSANLDWKFDNGSDNNLLKFRGTGNNLTSKVISVGDNNVFEINVSGNNNTNYFSVNGDNNFFTVNQTGGGAAGNSIQFDLTNTGNTVTIAQSGAVDNVVNVKSVSNGSTFNITQK